MKNLQGEAKAMTLQELHIYINSKAVPPLTKV